MSKDDVLRQHLIELMEGGHAHATFDQAVADLPVDMRSRTIKGMPHSAWSLLEHLRIAQRDIVEFSRSAEHQSPKWPDSYWPESPQCPSEDAWQASVDAFRRDFKAMGDLVRHPDTDLYARLPWGDGQTILREAMLVADHNAYHVGQLVTLRRALGAWTE